MITCSVSCNFFAVAALLAFSAAAEGEFRYRLEPTRIEPGQHARLELRLPKSLVPLSPEGEPELAQVEIRYELLEKAKGVVLLQQERYWEKDEAVWAFELTGHALGTLRVPPLEVIAGPNSFSTESQDLVVRMARAEGDDTPRENAGDEALPIRFPRWLETFVMALAAALAAAFLARWLYRRYGHLLRRPEAPIPLPPIPTESPDAWLKARLEEYRARLAKGEEEDQLVDHLTQILREYFRRASGRPVHAWTTRELRDRLSTDSRATRLATDVFEPCDRFKFQAGPRRPLLVAKDCLDRTERILFACAS